MTQPTGLPVGTINVDRSLLQLDRDCGYRTARIRLGEQWREGALPIRTAVIGNQIIPAELPETSDVELESLQRAVSQLPDALGSLEAGVRKQDERLVVEGGNLSESEQERFQAMFFELQSTVEISSKAN